MEEFHSYFFQVGQLVVHTNTKNTSVSAERRIRTNVCFYSSGGEFDPEQMTLHSFW